MVFPSHLKQLLSAPLLVRMGTGSKSTAEPLPSEHRVAGEDVEVWADSVELFNHPYLTVGIQVHSKIRFANLVIDN